MTIIMFLTVVFSSASPIVAADYGIGCGGGLGPLAGIFCTTTDKVAAKVEAGNQLNKLISTIIGVMTAVAALYFIFQFIIAGMQWISSGGEKNNLEEARNKITNSLIGLIIVVAAWIIIGVIGNIIGLDILNPGGILQNLGK